MEGGALMMGQDKTLVRHNDMVDCAIKGIKRLKVYAWHIEAIKSGVDDAHTMVTRRHEKEHVPYDDKVYITEYFRSVECPLQHVFNNSPISSDSFMNACPTSFLLMKALISGISKAPEYPNFLNFVISTVLYHIDGQATLHSYHMSFSSIDVLEDFSQFMKISHSPFY